MLNNDVLLEEMKSLEISLIVRIGKLKFQWEIGHLFIFLTTTYCIECSDIQILLSYHIEIGPC